MCMDDLRIAHISGYIGACYGGVPQVILALCRETARLGASVTIWATGTPDEQLDVQRHDAPVKLYEKHWPRRWFRSPALIRDLRNGLGEIDLLHLHGVWTHLQQGSSRLARKAHIPYVLSPHGVLKPWSVRRKGFKKRLYLSVIGRRMLNSSACLHASAPFEVEGFRRAGYGGPVTIIPNGVAVPDYDVACLAEEADDVWPVLRNRRVVLFLSRISPEKGLDLLLPAFRDLTTQKAHDDVVLVLTGPGNGPYVRKIEYLVDKLGLDKHVMIAGFVNDCHKARLMSRADVYTLPSYSEGFSISILENLAVGTPALITTGCNFPEVAHVGAGLCCQPTRGDLAQGLRTLLDMPEEKRRLMGQRGRDLVKNNYTWDVIAGKHLTVYKCILNGRPIPLHPESTHAVTV